MEIASSVREKMRHMVPPSAAWAAGKAMAWAAAAGSGYSPWNPLSWARWDSMHYFTIAANGYQLIYEPRTMNNEFVSLFVLPCSLSIEIKNRFWGSGFQKR